MKDDRENGISPSSNPAFCLPAIAPKSDLSG